MGRAISSPIAYHESDAVKVREVIRLLENNGLVGAMVIEQTGTGYSAYLPDVAGCVAVGNAEEETRRNIEDALIAHFEAMREVGEPIPEPHTSVDYVEVAAERPHLSSRLRALS